YEDTLKREFLKIACENPLFVLLTLFAKLGVLLFFLIKFANIGLLAAYLFPKAWWIDIAFFLGIAFNSIYVLIAVPLHEYALGFIALVALWSLESVNTALPIIIDKIEGRLRVGQSFEAIE
ncbi:MAG: hypothetical protein K2X39_04315, partial [Silvanigrellaceae bacterium]|nr:hypothetical protein [Silvanigrellaceae bacterium]